MMKNFIPACVAIAGFAMGASCETPKPFKLVEQANHDVFQQPKLLEKAEQQGEHPTSLPRLVNLWATWCAPCRKELPFLQQLAQNKQANVQLLNIEDSKSDAESTLKQLGIKQFTTRYAPMELLDNLGVQGLPASIVYHGENIYLGVGVLKNEQRIREWFNCLRHL